MTTQQLLDLVLAGVVSCEDSELVNRALQMDSSCICTSVPEKFGLTEDLCSTPAVVNPRTHDGSRVCGIRFKNIYVLSDLSMLEDCVGDLVLAFNMSRGPGEGQLIINEKGRRQC